MGTQAYAYAPQMATLLSQRMGDCGMQLYNYMDLKWRVCDISFCEFVQPTQFMGIGEGVGVG